MLLQPVQWLIDFLICLVKFGVGLLLAGLLDLINLLIAGFAALATGLLAILPTLNLGDFHWPSFIAWANWLFPLDQFLLATALVLTVLAAWPLVAMALRWVKFVG